MNRHNWDETRGILGAASMRQISRAKHVWLVRRSATRIDVVIADTGALYGDDLDRTVRSGLLIGYAQYGN